MLSKYINVKVYLNSVLSVTFVNCETCSLTVRNERILRLCENRVMRRIFGLKTEEVTGCWRKLPNGKLSDLYCSPNINRVIKSRRIKWADHVARVGEGRDA
jgi:hypothetical protein